ncbi:hypothetical protein CDV55_102062 [Aspergillus turcosus]|uniref:Uncharacterized protein n=1 Tax=Aspergillus turcosus TaxID=1245748 RepID=A0A397GH76_9EURO|nr:hypothetical protein CDV55_102062 [Aspergillus turcosus]RLL96111.1 hypothetical protein CFD26_102924 [Aspergillus turcosus]
MAPRRFLFEGDDTQYIKFLEEIVQRSGLVPPLALSATPKAGYDPQPYEYPREIAIHTPPASEDEGRTASQELQIIQFDPSKKYSRSRTRPNTERWKKELDDFIGRVCDINDMEARRKDLGLGDNQTVISSLIDGFSFTDNQLNTSGFSLSDSSILRTLSNYAHFTKKSTDVLSCLAHFRDLVFVSFCDVVLGSGEGRDRVHDTMRLYISDSSGQNLDKIISGSRWVNRCIANLSKTYWGLRSSEIFVLNGQTLNFYARLSAISDILGYDQVCTLECFRKYYAGRFSNRRIASFSFPNLNGGASKRKRDHITSTQSNKRNRRQHSPRQEESDGGSNRIPNNQGVGFTTIDPVEQSCTEARAIETLPSRVQSGNVFEEDCCLDQSPSTVIRHNSITALSLQNHEHQHQLRAASYSHTNTLAPTLDEDSAVESQAISYRVERTAEDPANFGITDSELRLTPEENEVRLSNHDARPADRTARVELAEVRQGQSSLPAALFTICSQDENTQGPGVDLVQGTLPSAPCPGVEQFVASAQHQTGEPHYASTFLSDDNDLRQVIPPDQTSYTYDFYNFLPRSPDWNSWGYDFSSNFR